MRCYDCPFVSFAPDGNDYCDLFGACITDPRIGTPPDEYSKDFESDDGGCWLTKHEIIKIINLQQTYNGIMDKAERRKKNSMANEHIR